MVFFRKRLILVGLMIALGMASLPTPAFALTVDGVAPGTITNDVTNTITVTGTGFVDGAVVLINSIALSTSFLNSGTLTAQVPAGFTTGTYNIEVRNSDSDLNTCACSLTINAPVIPTPTATSAPFNRPQLVVNSSGANVSSITSQKQFKFSVTFQNVGSVSALSAQVAFSSADLVPTKTGGVVALGALAAGGTATAEQTFISADSLYGKSIVIIDATVTYYDVSGTSYTDKFTLSVSVSGGGSGSSVSVTSTPTGVRNGQLIIPSYGTPIDPLQPGSQFTLTMTVQNAGNDKAQRVTMIVGGGSSGSNDGTPQAGGVSGGGGEFTNFAPVGTSNIQSLGDLAAGDMRQISQDLIVNVSTNPGAYPMKITFSYINSRGEVVNDEQVITLLVYSLPNVEVSFYRPPDLFFQGQPGALPIQVVNLGRRTAVLGNMKVTSKDGTVDGGEILVGALDAGGYFTLDATFFPDLAGETELDVVIDYTDDFNQPRTIEKTLKINVEETFIEPTPDPSIPVDEGYVEYQEESFLQKTWRFILGLFGLDSAPPPAEMPDPGMPVEEFPIPAEPGKGGGSG